jgi:hypothetical protein
MRLTKTSGIRALMLLAVTSSIFASGVRSSATPPELTSQQSPVTSDQTDRDQTTNCDIDGPVEHLKACPPETIIAQYKEQGVDVVLRGGAYWELITGKYVNEHYRYEIVLPEGVEALCAPAPAPWHGFFIDLAHKLTPPGDPSQSDGSFSLDDWDVSLWVDGSYNAAFFASVDDLVATRFEGYYEQASDAVVVEEAHTRLRRIPAIRYVVHFSDPKTGEPMISDNIAAIRRGWFTYEICLTTTASRYAEDATVLEQIIKGWRPLPIDD